jgi:hypothetical protein
MSVRVLTGFDSDSPRVKEDDREYDYEMVFAALVHNREVAKNVFARCAKRHFRSMFSDDTPLKLMMPDEVEEVLDGNFAPVFHAGLGVTFPVGTDDTKYPSMAKELMGLVSTLADSIKARNARVSRLGRGPVVFDHSQFAMIGPLSTMIKEVGKCLYSFTVKQRWGVYVKT